MLLFEWKHRKIWIIWNATFRPCLNVDETDGLRHFRQWHTQNLDKIWIFIFNKQQRLLNLISALNFHWINASFFNYFCWLSCCALSVASGFLDFRLHHVDAHLIKHVWKVFWLTEAQAGNIDILDRGGKSCHFSILWTEISTYISVDRWRSCCWPI